MNIPEITPAKDPLAQVAEQFSHWRTSRTKKGRIPQALWDLIYPLPAQYSLVQIQAALKINYSQLKKKCSAVNGDLKKNPFVQCQTQKLWPLLPVQGASLSFVCKTGKSVVLSGLQTSELTLVLNTLLGV